MFNNKSILITGGTGSFGKAFLKKILNKKDLTFLPLVNSKNKILDIYDYKKIDKIISEVFMRVS